MTDKPTKGERREDKRRNARKMRVSGRSVLLLMSLVRKPRPKSRRRGMSK